MPDESHFKYDVFISYSSKDKDWVRGELLAGIEQAGFKAFIDYRDFTPGAASINECERGVVTSRKTLLVLTPNYIGSGWGEMEASMLQTIDPANQSRRLIPLLKAVCEKPLRIGALTHIDFTDGADRELAWKKLLAALDQDGKSRIPAPAPLDLAIERRLRRNWMNLIAALVVLAASHGVLVGGGTTWLLVLAAICGVCTFPLAGPRFPARVKSWFADTRWLVAIWGLCIIVATTILMPGKVLTLVVRSGTIATIIATKQEQIDDPKNMEWSLEFRRSGKPSKVERPYYGQDVILGNDLFRISRGDKILAILRAPSGECAQWLLEIPEPTNPKTPLELTLDEKKLGPCPD